jgi:endoglucanase
MMNRQFLTCAGFVALICAGGANAQSVSGTPLGTAATVGASISSNDFLIGVNVSGAEYAGTAYARASDLDYLKSKGITLIRLPVAWERLQHVLNGPLDSIETTALEAFLDKAAAGGMQVIVDLHNYGRYSTNIADAGSGTGNVIGSAAVPIAAFQDLWIRLAAALKGHPGLAGYDLMNEPHDMGNTGVWPQAAQAAVNAIRSVDMGTTIYVEGDAWASAHDWPTDNGNLHVTDPADKLVYEAHIYFDSNGSGKYAKTYDQEGAFPGIGAVKLQPFLKWLALNNFKGFIGEFGVPDTDPRWIPVLDNFINELQKAGISGAIWLYRGGPTSWHNPLSVNPVNGVEQPQMAALLRHIRLIGIR